VSNVGYCERLLDLLDAEGFCFLEKRVIKGINSSNAIAFYYKLMAEVRNRLSDDTLFLQWGDLIYLKILDKGGLFIDLINLDIALSVGLHVLAHFRMGVEILITEDVRKELAKFMGAAL